MHDVIIIGGGYAGMAAALQLLRARRTVLVIDAGKRRNRFASHSHGFLGQDGVAPALIAAEARGQLAGYPTLTWIDGEAVSLTGSRDVFEVTLGEGQAHQGRRILFATGVSDELPEVEGIGSGGGERSSTVPTATATSSMRGGSVFSEADRCRCTRPSCLPNGARSPSSPMARLRWRKKPVAP